MRKILTVDGFVYNSEERMQECRATTIWNSKLLDEIHIMCENEKYKDFYDGIIHENKICNVFTHITNKSRPSCKDQFDFCNSIASDNDLKFFSNLDTTYCSDITKLDSYDLADTFITFSNRAMRNFNGQYQPMDGDPLDVFNKTLELDMSDNLWQKYEHTGGVWQVAHCGWAWITKKSMPEYNAFLGNPGGENILLHQVRDSGYKVKSAAVICRTFHNHRSDIRTERHSHRVGGAEGKGFINLSECLK
jgi:hypothetical protein